MIAASAAVAGPPHAIESRGGVGIWSGPEALRVGFAADNDSLFLLIAPNGLPYDRWVSASSNAFIRGPWRDHRVPFVPRAARVVWSLNAIHNIYTPRTAEIDTRAELGGDRPYSGVAALGGGLDVVLPDGPFSWVPPPLRATHLGVDVRAGVLGPWSGAGFVQYHLHWTYLRFEGKPLPPMYGWGRIETAPALLADLSAFAETTLAGARWQTPSLLSPVVDVIGGAPALVWRGGVSGAVGTWMDSASLTTELVFGWLADPVAPPDTLVPTALYLSARGTLHGVLYNATIDAPLVIGESAARHAPLVPEVQLGAVLRVWAFELFFFNVYRGNEVETQQRDLRFGQLLWRMGASVVF